MRCRPYSEHEIEVIPWDWKVPGYLINWDLEDVYQSMDHHYGVRCAFINQTESTKTGWERGLDSLLSGRMRKVLTLFDAQESSMVIQDTGGS